MVSENFQCVRHSLVSSIHHGGTLRKDFQTRGSQIARKCYFEIGFCKHSIL